MQTKLEWYQLLSWLSIKGSKMIIQIHIIVNPLVDIFFLSTKVNNIKCVCEDVTSFFSHSNQSVLLKAEFMIAYTLI